MAPGERLRLVLDVIATLAIVAASAALIWTHAIHGGAQPAPTAGARQLGEPITGLKTTTTPSTLAAAAGAKIAMIEFSDFQCPFCAQYAQQIYPDLEFIRPGLITYVFRHFPLRMHADAFAASEAAECAARQHKYSSMRSSLFAHQRGLSPQDLREYAVAIGLDRKTFERCLADGIGKDQVNADIREAERLGVTSTPTFFIGRIERTGVITIVRRLRGAYPYPVLKAELRKLL